MTSSPPSSQLPRIDEIEIVIEAQADCVWEALGRVLSEGPPRGSRPLGVVLGLRPLDASGDPLVAGATVRGFRVVAAEPAVRLALEGSHRFSRYGLSFRLDALDGRRTRLRAETRAGFPGAAGRLYRLAVIATRGHVVVVRHLLGKVRRTAEARAHP